MIRHLLTQTEKTNLNLWISQLSFEEIEAEETLSLYLIKLQHILKPKGIFQLLKHLAYHPIADLPTICQSLSISSSTARRYLYALNKILSTYHIQLSTKHIVYLTGDELLIRTLLLPYFILDTIEKSNTPLEPTVVFNQIKLFQLIRLRSNYSLLDYKQPTRSIDSYLFVSEQGFSYMWEQLLGLREITTLSTSTLSSNFKGNYALKTQNKLLVFFHRLKILTNCYCTQTYTQQFYQLMIQRYEYASYTLPFQFNHPLSLFAITCFFEPVYPSMLAIERFIERI